LRLGASIDDADSDAVDGALRKIDDLAETIPIRLRTVQYAMFAIQRTSSGARKYVDAVQAFVCAEHG
jgi:hypothetical protein